MPSIHTAEYSDYNTIDGTAPGRWNGSSPVNATLPDTAAALEAAIRIEDNLRKTFDRCMEMVDTWSQLRSYYEGPDQDIVYTAFENRLEKISALKLAGERLLEAFGLLDSTLETSVAGRHDEYVQWAGPYSAECREHEPELGEWCRGGIPTAHALWYRLGIDERDEDQVEKAEQILDTFNRLKSERLENYQVASQVVRDINEARRAVTDTLNEMKMFELESIRFETRDEATGVVQSQADVEEMLRNSEVFQSLEFGSDAEREAALKRIAGEVWADRSSWSDGHLTDDQGRNWVMTAEGTMVRAGSVMDSRLNAELMNAIGEDPVTSELEINYPGLTDGEKMTAGALLKALKKGNSKFEDWGVKVFEGETANIRGMKVTTGMLGASMSLLSAGATAGNYRNAQAILYPAMSEEDLDQRENRAFYLETIKSGGELVLGAGAQFVAVGAGAPTGGVGGVIVAAVIDKVTGAIVGWIVETVDESLTSATREEINQMTDEELAERGN